MKLSENFSLSEFTRSRTAEREGIDNAPDQLAVGNLRKLCENLLQPIHDAVGEVVEEEYYIKVTSGYRSEELNDAVGGSDTSFHLFGYAADIQLFIRKDDWVMDNALLFHIARQFPYNELVWEYLERRHAPDHKKQPKWVHAVYSQGDGRKMLKGIY